MPIPTAAVPDQVSLSYCLLDADGRELSAQAGRRPYYAASTIKLHVMLAVLRAADRGTLDLEDALTATRTFTGSDGAAFTLGGDHLDPTHPADGQQVRVRDLLQRMIDRSSNEATNHLVELVGLDEVAAAISDLDLDATRVERLIGDASALEAGATNETSAADLARTMHALVRPAPEPAPASASTSAPASASTPTPTSASASGSTPTPTSASASGSTPTSASAPTFTSAPASASASNPTSTPTSTSAAGSRAVAAPIAGLRAGSAPSAGLSRASRSLALGALTAQRIPVIAMSLRAGVAWGSKSGWVEGYRHDAAFIGDTGSPDLRVLAVMTAGMEQDEADQQIAGVVRRLLPELTTT